MRSLKRLLFVCAIGAVLTLGCGKKEDTKPPEGAPLRDGGVKQLGGKQTKEKPKMPTPPPPPPPPP